MESGKQPSLTSPQESSENRPVRSYDRRAIKSPLELFCADLCRQAAVRFAGIQKGFEVLPDQILFDNSFKSTLCLPIPGCTVEKIRAAVAASDAQWQAAQQKEAA